MTFSNAELALIEADPMIGALIQQNGPLTREPRHDYFAALARSIISQQISVKAAAAIFDRFSQATQLDPHAVAALGDDDLRAIGLSAQKSNYLRDLAAHFIRDSAIFDHLNTLADDEVIRELTRVKGIGVWTAQMFLMFALTRPDIFAPDDRGIQLAIQKLYALPNVPPRSELEELSRKWSPYRTVACWHLWHSLDNEPV
jgi:DNA-3-methyladenine glycosylase II